MFVYYWIKFQVDLLELCFQLCARVLQNCRKLAPDSGVFPFFHTVAHEINLGEKFSMLSSDGFELRKKVKNDGLEGNRRFVE